jgi:hypothetical protein
MKTILVLSILFFVSNRLVGQDNNRLGQFIASSINSYIVNDKDLVSQGFSVRDTSHYYICMDGLPATFPYDSVKNATFFSLHNLDGLPKSFKKRLRKKGIRAYFVWLELTDRELSIHIGSRGIKLRKNKNLEIIVSDWGIFTYEYFCETREWKLRTVKYGGV